MDKKYREALTTYGLNKLDEDALKLISAGVTMLEKIVDEGGLPPDNPEVFQRVDSVYLFKRIIIQYSTVLELRSEKSIPGFSSARYFDFVSATALVRHLLECAVVLGYVFDQQRSDEERWFLHEVWRLGGRLERLDTPYLYVNARHQEESALIDTAKSKIQATSIFSKLPKKVQGQALNGKWRRVLNKPNFKSLFWSQMVRSDLGAEFVRRAIDLTSQYNHSQSTIAFQQEANLTTQEEFARLSLLRSTIAFAYAIKTFSLIYPQCKTVLNLFPFGDLVKDYISMGRELGQRYAKKSK